MDSDNEPPKRTLDQRSPARTINAPRASSTPPPKRITDPTEYRELRAGVMAQLERLMDVEVPEGVEPGQSLVVDLPDGTEATVDVPEN